MGRLPFDPKKMAAAEKAAKASGAANSATPAGERPLRVSDLAALIDRALREKIPPRVRVVGEVSGFRDRTHWWFTLKDEGACLDCVMFQSAARRLGFALENGQEYVATGRVEHYAKQGRTQLYVEKLEPVGAGALELRFQQLCAELRELGWFGVERKRPLPWFPRRVAIVTSRTGAALQDVLDTMRRRCPAVEALIVDARVQGEQAAPEIASAIDFLSREHERLGIDAVIVTRGGGSMEDLWAFNERIVAEAIVRCAVPVAAAIGHETDTTIAELVADERCATPTQAAMRLTPDRAALAEQASQLDRRLSNALRASLRHASERVTRREHALRAAAHRLVSSRHVALERLGGRLGRVRPEAVYAGRHATLRDLERRLAHVIRRRLDRAPLERLEDRLLRASTRSVERSRERLAHLARTLDVVGPMRVLKRGYSMTLLEDGRVVRDATDVRPGDALVTRLATGEIRSVVEPQTTARPPHREPPPSPPPVRRGKRGPDGAQDDQLGLF